MYVTLLSTDINNNNNVIAFFITTSMRYCCRNLSIYIFKFTTLEQEFQVEFGIFVFTTIRHR